MLVHHQQVHEQVRAEHLVFEVGALDVQTGFIAGFFEQHVGQRAAAKQLRHRQLSGQACGRFGQRHKAAARALRQAFEQGLDLVFEQAGHQPFAAVFADLVEHKQRHRHGDPIAGVTRLVQISGRAVGAAQTDLFGEGLRGDACGFVAHQLFAGQQQQARLLGALMPVPVFKQAAAAHFGGDLLVIKSVDQLVVDQHILAARLVLQLFDLGDHLVVGGQERQLGLPLVAHQGFADEDDACAVQVDPAVGRAPPAVDHQAVKRGALKRHHFGGFLFPVRVEHLFAQQVRANLFKPLRLNRRNAPAKQARGFDQFGHHDPAARLFAQVRAGVFVKLDAACTQIGLFVFELVAHVAQQTRQHGQVQLLIRGRLRVDAPLVLGHHGEQLGVRVPPLAHATNVDEVLAQQLFVLPIAQLVLRRFLRGPAFNWGQIPIVLPRLSWRI